MSKPKKIPPPKKVRITAPRVTLGSARCQVFTLGMDMNCPLCDKRVRSGQHHECSR